MNKTRLQVAVMSALLAVGSGAAWPETAVAQAATQGYSIPAGDLEDALQQYATQNRLQLVYSSELVAGKRSRGLSGNHTREEALRLLLEGMGLRAEAVDANTIALRKLEAGGTTPQPRERSAVRQDADDQEAKDLPTITVRKPFTDANVDIVRTENDPQPYYIYSGEEIAKANTINLEDFIQQRLTMSTVSRTESDFSYNGLATSRVNLRGLGTDQTLILVNGRRTNGSNDAQFDLNAFSPSMIERIEVLPSSASAIYGGSAVGGVLNIILKRDFTGGDVQISYDTPLDKHAPVRTLSAGYGWSLEDGRTNITLSAAYRDSEPLLLRDRPEFLEGYALAIERAPGRIYSPNSPAWFGTTPNIASANGTPLRFKNEGPLGGASLGSSLTYVPLGISPATSLAELQAGLLGNAGQQNTTLTDSNVWGALSGTRRAFEPRTETLFLSGAIRRKMTDHLELIAEAFYSSNEGRNSTGPDEIFVVPSSSPANPFQQDVRVRTLVTTDDFGLAVTRRESLRMVAGFVLDLPHDWRAQGDYTWNRTQTPFWAERFDNASGRAASAAALADGTLDPFVDTLAHLEIFAPYMTPADRDMRNLKNALTDAGLRVSGPIGRLPAGQPSLTIGLGHRQEKLLERYRDFGYRPGYAGYGRTTYFPQSQSISSLYTEALVPLIAPANAVPGVRLLDLQLAGRLEDFSVDTGTASRITYPPDHAVNPNEVLVREKIDYSVMTTTAGLRYKPVDSLTLRASYATAFLPPSYDQLLPNPVEPPSLIGGGHPDPRRDDEFMFGTRLTGGNPDLKPMEARTLNVGLLFEPTFLKGLRAGVEWFRIERENLIFTPSIPLLMANEAVFADRITRAQPAPGDPYGVGPVTQLDLRSINVNQVSMDGIDLSLGYRRASDRLGLFSVDAQATFIDSFTRVLSPISPEEDIAGWVNNGGPLKLRANATFGWEYGPWSLSWTTLYYGPYDQATDRQGAIATQGRTTVPHQIYHNFLAGYRFEGGGASGARSALSDLTVTLGVRNIFNSLPPLDGYNLENSAPRSVFGDWRMRSVQLSIAKRFN